MKLKVDRFRDAIDYLAAFVRDYESITFTPHGQLVRISASGQAAYAEVWLQSEESLAARFAVQLHVIRRIVHCLDDGEILYRQGSQSSWEQDSRRWWIPYSSVEDSRPNVEPERSTYWDGQFGPLLRLMRTCTRETENNASALDCVRMEITEHRRSIVATDGVALSSFSSDANADDTDFGVLMIERQIIPLIEKTCESGMKVEIAAGIKSYSIKCGRRLAIFPLREGMFPRWREIIKEQQQGKMSGSVSPDKDHLRHVAKQASIVCSSVIMTAESDSLVFDATSEDTGFAEVGIPVVRKGAFGPLRLKADYLRRIAEAWPAMTLQMQFRGPERPLIIQSSEADSKLVSLIMPVRI